VNESVTSRISKVFSRNEATVLDDLLRWEGRWRAASIQKVLCGIQRIIKWNCDGENSASPMAPSPN
jgi:hypothetical protein